VKENNTDAAKTVKQQGLVLKEWFQYPAVAQAALNQPLRRHHSVLVANLVAVQTEKRTPFQNHVKAKLVRSIRINN
jgi:hypothetical protein